LAVKAGLVSELSVPAVMDSLRCSRRTAERLTQAARAEIEAAREEMRRERDEEIVAASAAGKSVRDIAADKGLSPSTVHEIIAVRRPPPMAEGEHRSSNEPRQNIASEADLFPGQAQPAAIPVATTHDTIPAPPIADPDTAARVLDIFAQIKALPDAKTAAGEAAGEPKVGPPLGYVFAWIIEFNRHYQALRANTNPTHH
jgi:hypothetical protein